MVFVVVFQVLFWLALLVAILYLIGRRIDEKNSETFEDRDN